MIVVSIFSFRGENTSSIHRRHAPSSVSLKGRSGSKKSPFGLYSDRKESRGNDQDQFGVSPVRTDEIENCDDIARR